MFNTKYSVCRQEAFKRAVANAKSKAQCISQSVGVQLGPAIEVTEISQDAILGPNSMTEMLEPDLSQNEFLPTSLYVKFGKETLIFKSQVSVVFESQPLRTCTHKKCKKH